MANLGVVPLLRFSFLRRAPLLAFFLLRIAFVLPVLDAINSLSK